jgi:hypothetical protein
MGPNSTKTKTESSEDTKICYFLNKFPREVRDKIYKLLLVNEVLSNPRALCSEWAHVNVKLNLSTAILLTCRQIYEEASEILYGDNKFVACVHGFNPMMRSIFERWVEFGFRRDLYKDYLGLGGQTVAKVKHWIIVIDTYEKFKGKNHRNKQSHWPKATFVWFLRAICESNVASLQILVLPYEAYVPPSDAYDSAREREMKKGVLGYLHTKLEPLICMLRNVQSFEIRYINDQDGPIWKFYKKYRPFQGNSPFFDWGSIERLQRLAPMLKSNEPAVRVFKMHQRLTEYAQTFERCLPYKQQMGNVDDFETIWSGPPHSPFVQGRHPVEEGLRDAAKASYFNRLDAFNQKRAIVLDYLEPQYQKVVAATLALTNFIKENKQKGKIFDPNRCSMIDEDLALAVILIEDLEQSFRRDMPHSTMAFIRGKQDQFELQYDVLPREALLKQMKLKFNQVMNNSTERVYMENEWISVVDLMKLAVEDMEAQYLEIRAARRRLFESDIKGDSECAIDVESSRCDEKIDWSVLEPDIGAAPKPERPARWRFPLAYNPWAKCDRCYAQEKHRNEDQDEADDLWANTDDDTDDDTENDRNVWGEVEHRSEDQDKAVDMNEDVEVDDDQENNSVGVWKSAQEGTQDN